MAYKTLIVDDEPLGCERIAQLLAAESDFEIVATCHDGHQALAQLEQQPCDLLFLDINMPELDGFDVLRLCPQDPLPQIVFVSAYDQYAIQAFRVHALDYLLKPVEREIFAQTLQRIRSKLSSPTVVATEQQAYQQNIHTLLNEDSLQRVKRRFLPVKRGERIVLLKYPDILTLQAQGNYLVVSTADGQYKIRQTLAGFAQQQYAGFIQVNRSYIINVEHIREIQPYFKGELMVLLSNGDEIATSAGYRDNLKQLLS